MTGPGQGVAGIVLAAGASSRMGRPKMLLPMDGGTLLSMVSRALLDGGLSAVAVVLGHDAERVRRESGLPEDSRLRIVVNQDWPSGMASSLRAGLGACGDSEAVLVALGDQPGITADRVRRIVSACRPGGSLVLPAHEGRAGHPVLFGRRLFDELRALRGDVGGRDVVIRHLAQAVLVEAEPLFDLDTAEDLSRHQAGMPPLNNGLDLGGSPRRTGRH